MKGERSEVILKKWNELIGVFKGLSTDRYYTYVKINEEFLVFENESDEAYYLQEKLGANDIGRRIGILRTNIPGKSLLVRRISLKKNTIIK